MGKDRSGFAQDGYQPQRVRPDSGTVQNGYQPAERGYQPSSQPSAPNPPTGGSSVKPPTQSK